MIYFDNAATTKLKKEALEAMLPYLTDSFANPSAIYLAAGKTRRALENAREVIAKKINADRSEIFFTSGGTESDNWAIRGAAESMREKGKHIITCAFEHHAVLNCCRALEKEGFTVTYLSGNSEGFVTPEDILAAIRPDTILISVMAANNETGVLQPIKEIGELAKKHHILFHTDAVQGFCHIPLDVKEMNIDLLSATAHKAGGPRGIGFLYKKREADILPMIYGGGQERDMRSGTENVAAAAGFAAAVINNGDASSVKRLRDYLLDRLLTEIPEVRLNGSREKRLPGNINISIDGVRGESVVMRLSSLDICASTGSACTAGDGKPSHVLRALGLDKDACNASLRITLNEDNTKEEADIFAEELKAIVADLRKMRL